MNDIRKFDEFINLMNESYNTPVNIDWIKNTPTDDGEFFINGTKYLIECSEWGNGVWSYKFSRIENGEKIMDLVEDSKNKMSALSTIRNGMEDLIRSKNPNGLLINVVDSSRGRETLYERHSKEISDRYKYTYTKKSVLNSTTFFLYKEDIITFEMITMSYNKMANLYI